MKHKLLAVLLLAGITLAWAVPARAENSSSPVISVGVIQPSEIPEQSRIQLKPENPAFPMPNEAENGKCILTIQNRGEFPPIRFQNPGVYRYTLCQLKGENPDCRYDLEPYFLKITVTEEKGELQAFLTATRGSAKAEQLIFENFYEEPPIAPQTGDPLGWGIWFIMLAASAVGTGILCSHRKSQ